MEGKLLPHLILEEKTRQMYDELPNLMGNDFSIKDDNRN